MANYILPQVVINQLFSEVTLNTIRNQNCLVFGPNYQLFRYTNPETHDGLRLGAYNGSTVVTPDGEETRVFDYPGQPANSDVDTGYVKLFGENVVIGLTSVDGFTKLDDDESGADLDGRLKFDVCIAGAFRDERFKRDIGVGDLIRIRTNDSNDQYFESQILEVFASEFAGRYDSVRIADTLPDSIVLDGDSNDQFDGEVEFCASLKGVEIAQRSPAAETSAIYQWTAGEEEFEIGEENLVILYPSWDGKPHQIISADLFLEYRALLLGAADTIHSIERSTDVTNMLGEIDVDNPLAYAVQKCTQNSADRVVYYMATRGEDKASYAKVLENAAKTDDVYFLVPLTQDPEILDLVQGHVEEMSGKNNKRWRVAFVCSEVPESKTLYTPASSTDGKGFYAVVEKATSGKYAGENVLLRFVEGEGDTSDKPSTATKCMSQVVAGDTVVMYPGKKDIWGDEVTDKYTVRKVLSNTVLLLAEEAPATIEHGMRTEVVHEYSYQEKTTAIASTSAQFASRRMYNVFPDWARSGGTTFNGVHLAAAAAGVASSVLPQQPITNLEIVGVDDIPMVYETYTRTQLNEIAAGGTFIIMQDLPGDQVYIRHQISTDYTSGNLLKSELSITKNLDSISYMFAEAYKPYIGRYNITPGLLEVIRAVATDVLTELEGETASGLYGPQVLAEGTEITQLYQDPVNQDHVYMHLKLNLPRPFNVLDLDLEVI